MGKLKNHHLLVWTFFENITIYVMNQWSILGPLAIFSILKMINGSDLHS